MFKTLIWSSLLWRLDDSLLLENLEIFLLIYKEYANNSLKSVSYIIFFIYSKFRFRGTNLIDSADFLASISPIRGTWLNILVSENILTIIINKRILKGAESNKYNNVLYTSQKHCHRQNIFFYHRKVHHTYTCIKYKVFGKQIIQHINKSTFTAV